MREGIVKNDIYIKEVKIKFGKKEKIYIKYVEKGVDKTVEDEDRATADFYNVLRKLKKAGNRMLDFPYPVDTRIVITGAKFKWKDYKLQEVKLIGNYILKFSGVIEQKFFPKSYTETTEPHGFTSEEMDLLEDLQMQAIMYVQGVREQTNLFPINTPLLHKTEETNEKDE